MDVFSQIRSLGGRKALRAPLAASLLLFVLPALVRAQTVFYTANGLVSITGGPPIYNGKYVLKQSDFGFFWLDTAALAPGHVQAESKCTGFQPPSDTGIYVIGDCNGITNISSSGNFVLVRQFSGQCGAAMIGCPGPRSDGHSRFTFALGSFDYLGDLGEIADSTQSADTQGRTWTLQPSDASGLHFVWTASGGNPTSPPIASAFATNLSAASRSDKTNLYGDKWQLQNTSNPSATSVTWDFNYTGSFAADETGSEAAEGTVVAYFPCDPTFGGVIRSGANCRQSLGLGNPPATVSYQFALRSANQYGPSANTFVSSSLPVVCPQAVIDGYAGFAGSCAKTSGTLTVPGAGTADASASKGNLAEAFFSWTFTSSSGIPTNLQGQVVTVPGGSTGFTLTIAFPGGYMASAAGSVAFAPALVPEFSTPSPVIRSSTFYLTNLMQKPSTTTLNSVDSLIAPGACGAPPFVPTNPLASSFLTAGGTAPVTAPGAIGGYCITLKYNYTPQGAFPTSDFVSHSLTVTDWSPSPFIGVYLDSARTLSAPFAGSSFYLSTGTSYYLNDDESPPPAGTAYPGASWSLVSSSGEVPLGATATQGPLAVKFTSPCTGFCFLKVVVGAVTRQIAANITIGSCVADGTTLCLNFGRFKVQVTWATTDGRSGAGQAVALTGDTGYFWFFTSGNVEMIVKVVDGRVVNSSFWVFAGGLTDVDVVVTITDVQTGTVKTYRNPQGTPFQPIQDTSAFVVAATSDPSAAESATVSGAGASAALFPRDASAPCAASPTTLCVNNGRFQVQVQWTAKDGSTGPGQAVPLTGDTGYFWFFTANNVEMVVKVVNGCSLFSSYWVFAGGLTDVNVVMTVTDTQTGTVRTYLNPQGTAFQPIQDTAAFATCP